MRFQLVRYFSLTSFFLFALVLAVLAYFEHQQEVFFQQTQDEQIQFFGNVQKDFATQQEKAAVADLLTIHESGNVNLTRLFANALWTTDFAPFVQQVQTIDVAPCQGIDDLKDAAGKSFAPPEKKECFAGIGRKIQALRDFQALDTKVFNAMKNSTVFKIKVFDLRGITLYSSEHQQIGEDKSSNAGWRGAALNKSPTSELTHRDRFSAFEGVVENRDLISSYLPMFEPGTDRVVGVFEVYSDVTPFLAHIRKVSEQTRKAAQANQMRVEQAALESAAKVAQSATLQLAGLVAVLALLFAALFAIVWRADRLIKAQVKEQERAQQQLAQSEKMAMLGQMVAGVTHQLNTPLAFSQNNVSMALDTVKNFRLPLKLATLLADSLRESQGGRLSLQLNEKRADITAMNASENDVTMVTEMLGDTLQGIEQMRELVENLRNFTRLDRAKVAAFNLNHGLHNVVYLARSVAPVSVSIVEEFGELPQLECNPSQLNQVFLNLINNAIQSIDGVGTVTVRSSTDDGRIRVDVIDTGCGISEEDLPHIFETYYTTKPAGQGTGLGLAIAQDIVKVHGGEIVVQSKLAAGTTFTVFFAPVT